ncbi:MAG: PKD domain-containing protein, partial [Steroidobacteraceae bacterium]
SWGALAAALLALAGCGGGGGGGGASSNQSPTASFTVTPGVAQAPVTVTVNAAASSDPDGSIASYSWNFGDGGTGSGATATHAYATANTYTITLTVTDDDGATGSTTRTVYVTAGPPPPSVTVSGRITFERVPFSSSSDGLEYLDTFEAPAREVEVQLLPAAGGAPIATTSTDQDGNYTFTAPLATEVRVRASALSKFTGTPARPSTWDLRVLNNTNSNALYVLDGTAFNTGVANVTRNLKATTGWAGFAGYTGTRAAAPFAVLDTLYSAAQFVIANAGASAVQFPAMSAFWSTQNRPSSGWNPAIGDIQTTLYQTTSRDGFPAGIYVLGTASTDTDEFDQHVLAHEFQHFLEDAVSRTDTVGGDHSLSENLDMRVAFSEGLSNAFSAMVLTGLVEDPEIYRDSLHLAFNDQDPSEGWFDMETEEWGTPGWYNEASVHRIAWDLFDTANDGADGDAVSVGFVPMLDVMRTQLRDDSPLTSLFSFVTALKLHPSVVPVAAAVTSRVDVEGGIVAATMDAYATTETNAGDVDETIVLPVYSAMTLNGPTVRRCADVTEGSYNKLGNRRFVRFNVPSARTISVRVECPSSDASCTDSPAPDPDLILSRGELLWFGDSTDARVEEIDANVTAGDYVLEFYEYSHTLPEGSTQRGRTCMTVSITG